MEEENEVLDWGNEEDEHHQANAQFPEDADDAVSLGDEEDEQTFYVQQFPETNGGTPLARGSEGDYVDRPYSREMSVDQFFQPQQQDASLTQASTSNQKESPKRSQPLLQPRLTHALPPKPVASSMPYIPPSHPSIVEATAMSARTRDHKRNVATTEKTSPYKEPLPPDWEVRHPRSGGRTCYYYNVVTHESTWYHPLSSTPNRTKQGSTPNKLPSATSYGSSALSFEDRHYRPGSPDTQHDDRVPDGFDLRPTEREHTPPRSPRARGRARSASPASVPQRPSPAEPRDRNRSTHSNSADTKGDFSDVVRDRNVPAIDSSASRWGPSSKAHNETSGRETRHIQHTPTGVTGVESATEDGSMLLRSHSSRGRNRERESASGVADGRQNLNQGQSLPASRHHSPPPPLHHDREWIPARREQRGSDVAKQPSVLPAKVESTPRNAVASAGPRRDKPSRFDQPLPNPALPAPPAIDHGLGSTTERSLLHHRERDVRHSDANAHARQAERDVLTSSPQALIDNTRTTYIDDRSTHANHRQQVDPEYTTSVPDQPGPSPRRKRAPLPPQAASFREEALRRRDEPQRPSVSCPPPSQTNIPFPSGPREYQRPDVNNPTGPPHGPRQSAPPYTEATRRRPRSVSGPRYTDNTGRERTLSTDYSGSGSGYSQAQAHTPTDVPMDVDVDSIPSSSSWVPPAPLPDLSNDSVPKPPNRALVPTTTTGISPPTRSFTTHVGDEKRSDRIGTTEQQSPQNRQDFLPRNQRVIYDGTDRHVPRRDTRNHPNDIHRPGLSGFTPKLTGPNSVPIGNRRQTGVSHDIGSRPPDVAPHPLESPIRNPKPLPPLPPGKESYERPVCDAKAATDSYRVIQHDNAGPNLRRQRNSPPSHTRDYTSPNPMTTNAKDVRRDFQPRERSRFDQPLREGRVPQSYERPPPEVHVRAAPPLRNPTPQLDKAYQPLRSVVESHEPLQSAHAKLLAAKEKIEKLDQQHRLRKEEEHQADRSKPSPVELSSTQEWQDKTVAEDRLRNLRLQEQRYPDDQGPPRPSSPKLLPAKGREDTKPPPSQGRPSLPDAQVGHPVDHEPVAQRQRHEGHAIRFDNAHDQRRVEGQNYNRSIPSSHPIVPLERISHEPRRPERPSPSDTTPVPPSAGRRTRWGAPVSAAGASDAPERSDSRDRRPDQVDRYEPVSDDLSEAPQRYRPQPTPAKDDVQLGESSRVHEIRPAPPRRVEYEKAPPTSRRLLDRLSLDPLMPINDQSLWDRVQIPEKRDRNEVDHPMDVYEADAMGTGEPTVKRARRRPNKPRKTRRGGAPL